ncbi:hypothetical protein J4464_05145 [Candidatus Woesearchaeota archaeon]|nr:hypothetical protein [Candidatus Woesearchaeota archaeon]
MIGSTKMLRTLDRVISDMSDEAFMAFAREVEFGRQWFIAGEQNAEIAICPKGMMRERGLPDAPYWNRLARKMQFSPLYDRVLHGLSERGYTHPTAESPFPGIEHEKEQLAIADAINILHRERYQGVQMTHTSVTRKESEEARKTLDAYDFSGTYTSAEDPLSIFLGRECDWTFGRSLMPEWFEAVLRPKPMPHLAYQPAQH